MTSFRGVQELTDIRNIVNMCLEDPEMRTKVKHILKEQNNAGGDGIDSHQLLSALKEHGILDEVMAKLKVVSVKGNDDVNLSELPLSVSSKIKKNRRYLLLDIIGGRAFVENIIHETDRGDGIVLPRNTPTMTVHIHFSGQRFQTAPVHCSCDPVFDEQFLIELSSENSSVSDLLGLNEPIQLVIVKQNSTGDGSRQIVSCYQFEWRHVLGSATSSQKFCLELSGSSSSERHITVGLLDCSIEIIPRLASAQSKSETALLPSDVIATQLGLERSRQSERERLFLTYAKHWWKEYLQIDQERHSQRLVKIFAADEEGVNRPVCCYVKPTRVGRALASPCDAARFVSLFDVTKSSVVGVSDALGVSWRTFHASLVARGADTHSLACLLASLLLGFGLDAYVCVGAKRISVNSASLACHSWVMTMSHADGAKTSAVTFWEPQTAQRHQLERPHATVSPAMPYKTIGCVFNHVNFWATVQPSDEVSQTTFDLSDASLWKSMSTDAVAAVRPGLAPTMPPLVESRLPSTVASYANTLENELRGLIVDWRRANLSSDTVFDNALSYALTPALVDYELERSRHVLANKTHDDFQSAVRHLIPNGHTFKGYPYCCNHLDASRLFAAAMRSPVCQAVIGAKGDQTRLALRVHLTPYPEGSFAVWVMVACRYKAIL